MSILPYSLLHWIYLLWNGRKYILWDNIFWEEVHVRGNRINISHRNDVTGYLIPILLSWNRLTKTFTTNSISISYGNDVTWYFIPFLLLMTSLDISFQFEGTTPVKTFTRNRIKIIDRNGVNQIFFLILLLWNSGKYTDKNVFEETE
jgi:hypothetical protein